MSDITNTPSTPDSVPDADPNAATTDGAVDPAQNPAPVVNDPTAPATFGQAPSRVLRVNLTDVELSYLVGLVAADWEAGLTKEGWAAPAGVIDALANAS